MTRTHRFVWLALSLAALAVAVWLVGADDAAEAGAAGRELLTLFEQDQADRTGGVRGDELRRRDAERRARVAELLGADQLASAEDYYLAAMIYQHSVEVDDYLKAHVLASVAAFEGHREARWLVAATLDRYLELSGRQQFFGTQYEQDDEGRWKPGDFDPMLSETLRAEYELPSLESMRERAASWN